MAKKNKIRKLTDEQYLAYIAGLKNDASLFSPTGELIVPDAFVKTEKNEEKQGD